MVAPAQGPYQAQRKLIYLLTYQKFECLIVPITFLSRNDIKVNNRDKCSALMTLTCLGGD